MIPDKLKNAYMKTAYSFSECSTATRLKVGAVLVKDNNIISFSYNGTPYNWSNICEDENNVTLPEVIHAETNLLIKLARNGNSSAQGSTMFVTHSPCFQCAKLIYQAGIKEIYYSQQYRCKDGIEFLQKMGIKVSQLS